jgi:hypothetical protein
MNTVILGSLVAMFLGFAQFSPLDGLSLAMFLTEWAAWLAVIDLAVWLAVYLIARAIKKRKTK